jgi:hypothetical protein
MVVLDLSGDYLNFESSKDGDMCVIVTEAKPTFNETLKKEIVDMKVEKDGKQYTYSPNLSAQRSFTDAFGKDTKEWIGKTFEILHVQGKMAVRPVKAQKVI